MEDPPSEASDSADAQALEEKAPKQEKPQHKRRRVRVPTTVLLTLLGAALTVWIAPALTRQWDDRQKVRELKAAAVDEIATETASTIFAGAQVARSPSAAVRTKRVAAALARWQQVDFRMALKLNANFGAETAQRWSDYSSLLRDFVFNADLVPSDTGPRVYWDAPSWSKADRRPLLVDYLVGLFANRLPSEPNRDTSGDREWTRTFVTTQLLSDQTADFEYAIEAITRYLLGLAENVTNAILAAHPPGFSTTRDDLLRDLLP